jgi:hypothetical protein
MGAPLLDLTWDGGRARELDLAVVENGLEVGFDAALAREGRAGGWWCSCGRQTPRPCSRRSSSAGGRSIRGATSAIDPARRPVVMSFRARRRHTGHERNHR